MYDPVHRMYHLFYQIHLAEDMNGSGNGPDWGHWVSRDFVKWAQLPVAIWNDQYYDNSAIYTGSVTIVNGKPVIVYPGKCDGKMGCNGGKGGFTYDLAVPKNASDPLYIEWAKTGEVAGKQFTNPVLNNTSDDPSTGWKSKYGEWRLIGNGGFGCSNNSLFGSMDFVNWYHIGCTPLQKGDCPSFFPLPSITPGSEHYLESHGDPLPNYVHYSGDVMQLGTWTDGTPGPKGTGTVGTWALTPGTKNVLLDKGKTHAAKDFYDPVKKRRIMWVWATQSTFPAGLQTLPRSLTYHPGIKRIVFSPAEELVTLRTGPIGQLKKTDLSPGTKVPIAVSDATDLELFFEIPINATTLSVTIGNAVVELDFVPSPGSDPYSVLVHAGGATEDLWLLPDDSVLAMRIFLDGNVGETYWQGGRVVITFPATTTTKSATIQSIKADAKLINATAFGMRSIYTTPDEVLATPYL